jgi:hypothetical protein
MTTKTKLVNGVQLLELLFDETSRPSLRWLRLQQKRRAVPYIKIGRLVRYDPARVREIFSRRFTVDVNISSVTASREIR